MRDWAETLNGRRNVYDVFRGWMRGETVNRNSIRTDGRSIWSYGTCILATSDRGPVLNASRYSLTTTRHQNGIREGMRRMVAIVAREVEGLDRGVSPETVTNAAR